MIFSIILVCKNSEKFISDFLKNMLQLDYDKYELIIIDGNSQDRTLEIIKQYKNKFIKILSEPDQGLYYAMNKGIKWSRGDYILFLGADDKLKKNALSKIEETFKKNSEAKIIYGNLQYHNNLGNDRNLLRVKREQFPLTMIPHPATFFRKEIFQEIGFYDVSYKVSSDYELLARCYAADVNIHHVDIVTTISIPYGFSNKYKFSCLIEDFRIRNKYKLASYRKVLTIFCSSLLSILINSYTSINN